MLQRIRQKLPALSRASYQASAATNSATTSADANAALRVNAVTVEMQLIEQSRQSGGIFCVLSQLHVPGRFSKVFVAARRFANRTLSVPRWIVWCSKFTYEMNHVESGRR